MGEPRNETPDTDDADSTSAGEVMAVLKSPTGDLATSDSIPTVDRLSATSLYLKLYARGNFLSNATAFVVSHCGRAFLVTNWHVLSGRHAETEKPLSKTAGIPDQVRIAHHMKSKLGRWRFIREQLYRADGSPIWVEHPRGREIDVAVLELRNVPEDVQLYGFDLALADVDLDTPPGTPVSVIGFPLGLRPNVFFAIWKTGHIASDVDIPYRNGPAFLIDATTREGMSGSPVVARRWVNEPTQQWEHALDPMTVSVRTVLRTKFLGVYASRVNDDAEIGCVWRPSAIREVLERAVA